MQWKASTESQANSNTPHLEFQSSFRVYGGSMVHVGNFHRIRTIGCDHCSGGRLKQLPWLHELNDGIIYIYIYIYMFLAKRTCDVVNGTFGWDPEVLLKQTTIECRKVVRASFDLCLYFHSIPVLGPQGRWNIGSETPNKSRFARENTVTCRTAAHAK